jgi:hypothetical protein
VAEPVVAEEEAPCRRSKRNRRNDWHRSRRPQAPHGTDTPLHALLGAPESRAPLSTRRRAPAGVPSLRMCRCPSELVRAHSQGGHPRESRIGEARHSHQAGRRDVRRWPKPSEDDIRLKPPQGDEPKRRRDQRRTRRQAGGSGKRTQGRCCGARFFESPAFCHIRLRLCSSSPPFGDQGRDYQLIANGRLRSSRRPSSSPLHASPSRASRGLPI